MKNEKMEIFKKNLEGHGFSSEFIQLAINYFNELIEEMEVQEMNNIEEAIQYFDKIGSYTCNTLQSEENLKELREDIAKLFDCDTNNILKSLKYFENIEEFEIQILYCLYYEFYPITLNFVEMKNFIQNRGKKNKKKYNGLLRFKIIMDCLKSIFLCSFQKIKIILINNNR